MDDYYVDLSDEQLQSFNENGYLVIPGFFNPDESTELQNWAQEVHDLPRTADVPWMPYEVSPSQFIAESTSDGSSRPGGEWARKASVMSN